MDETKPPIVSCQRSFIYSIINILGDNSCAMFTYVNRDPI